jgi:hypothetical protein
MRPSQRCPRVLVVQRRSPARWNRAPSLISSRVAACGKTPLDSGWFPSRTMTRSRFATSAKSEAPVEGNRGLLGLAIDLPRSPAIADDASALIGRWLVPSREQEKSKMSPHCQRYAETDVQTVPESEIEILSLSCDDPAFAAQKARILDFVKSVNEVYRAQNRPLYSETPSGYAQSCARQRQDVRPIFVIRAKNSAGPRSKICRSSGISGHQETTNGR